MASETSIGPRIAVWTVAVACLVGSGGSAAAQQYFYWSDDGTNTIGRANLDGSSPNQSWITGCNGPYAVTVDDSYVYWTNYSNGSIGRANIDGSSPDQSWITGGSTPTGVAAAPAPIPVELVSFTIE